jgi:hypothetical protein
MTVARNMFALVGAAVLLSACATSADVLNARMQSVPESERAYIVGRFAVECKARKDACRQTFDSISASFRSTDGKGVSHVMGSTVGSAFGTNTVNDFESPGTLESGYYFCQALPAGSYAFYTYEYYNFAGGGTGYYLPEENQFTLPFQLAPGEIAYLGRLKLTTSVGKNLFGMKLNVPGVLLLSADRENDLPLALLKCPEAVRSRAVRDALLLDSIEAGSATVQRDPSPP